MDKKNTFIGALFLAAAAFAFYYSAKHGPRPAPPITPITQTAPAATTPSTNTATGPEDASSTTPAPAPASSATTARPVAQPAPNGVFAPLVPTDGSARIVTLGNDFIEARLSDFGGAIENVAFKKYPAVEGSTEPFIFNEEHTEPMLAFTQGSFPGLDRTTRYEIVSQTATEVVFRAIWENRVEVTRRYSIVPAGAPADKADPYQLRHETTFRNLTDQTVALPHFQLSLGTAAPINGSDPGTHLVTGYNTGTDIDFVTRANLQGGGLLSMVGIGSREPIPFKDTPVPLVWASVENQFFTTILTPDVPARGLTSRRVEFPSPAGTTRPPVGVTGSAGFDIPALAANAQASVGMDFYAGPKEFKRLSNGDIFKHDQDKVMQFGFFRIFSQLLLTIMTAVHSVVPNWGWAIIITTLSLKLVFLPLTLSASKSSKRMQKVQPQLKELREKYKDNPQKMQQATMEIFKANRVNPVGGCLPVLITIPFFFGFYRMLMSTAELRFAPFLWSNDLSMPDTVGHLLGFPINVMPILMGVTMIVQMHLTPQPSVDNAQAKMFKFMPYIFAFFCYNFPVALSLYSTINGLFTIGQQLIINRMKDSPLPAPVVAARGGKSGKGMKNVTPKK